MRLFKNFEPGSTTIEKSQNRSAQKKADKTRAPKPHISASEIRSKVQEHFSPKPEVDKVEVSKLAQAKNASVKEVVKPEVAKEEKELSKPSDVGLNDPKDPATVGKLKSVLSKGAFNFNAKEREALEKILADHD